jgi:hypothetical protein
MNWEYIAIRMDYLDSLIADLNSLGAQGWELVAIDHSSSVEDPSGVPSGA